MQVETALLALAMQLSNVVKMLVLCATNVPKCTVNTMSATSVRTPHTIPATACPGLAAPFVLPRLAAMPPRGGRRQASQQAKGEHGEGHHGHEAGHAEYKGGHARAVPRPGRCRRGKRLC
jgi:hypothetical protein